MKVGYPAETRLFIENFAGCVKYAAAPRRSRLISIMSPAALMLWRHQDHPGASGRIFFHFWYLIFLNRIFQTTSVALLWACRWPALHRGILWWIQSFSKIPESSQRCFEDSSAFSGLGLSISTDPGRIQLEGWFNKRFTSSPRNPANRLILISITSTTTTTTKHQYLSISIG